MVPIKNVYHMLTYAYDILKDKNFKKVAFEKCDNIYELLCLLLLHSLKILIKKGIVANYVLENDELSLLKGKINMTDSINKMSFLAHKMICDYDVYSENILFNQIIKSSLVILSKKNISQKMKKDLKNVLLYFENVNIINLKNIDWQLVYHKNNKYYEVVLFFCKLLFDESIALDGKVQGDFVIIEDLLSPKLFEKFIFKFYQKEFEKNTFFQKNIPWRSDNFIGLPNMSSDIMIFKDDHKLIIDTKFYAKTLRSSYYENSNEKVISSNLYQIFAYVKNLDFLKVSGLLLYPEINKEVDFSYFMDGNNIYVRTINLDADFDVIKFNLLKIMNEIYI